MLPSISGSDGCRSVLLQRNRDWIKQVGSTVDISLEPHSLWMSVHFQHFRILTDPTSRQGLSCIS